MSINNGIKYCSILLRQQLQMKCIGLLQSGSQLLDLSKDVRCTHITAGTVIVIQYRKDCKHFNVKTLYVYGVMSDGE